MINAIVYTNMTAPNRSPMNGLHIKHIRNIPNAISSSSRDILRSFEQF